MCYNYAASVCESPHYVRECAFRYLRVLVISSYCLVCPMHVTIFLNQPIHIDLISLHMLIIVTDFDRFSNAFDAVFFLIII